MMFADGLGLIWRQDIRNNYDWYDIGPVGIPRSAQPTDTGMYVGWVVQNRQVWLSVANNVFFNTKLLCLNCPHYHHRRGHVRFHNDPCFLVFDISILFLKLIEAEWRIYTSLN